MPLPQLAVVVLAVCVIGAAGQGYDQTTASLFGPAPAAPRATTATATRRIQDVLLEAQTRFHQGYCDAITEAWDVVRDDPALDYYTAERFCDMQILCGRAAAAERACAAALALGEDKYQSWYYVGIMFQYTGRPVESNRHFARAMEIIKARTPPSLTALSQVYYHHAALFLKVGQTDKAMAIASECIDVLPPGGDRTSCLRLMADAAFQDGQLSLAARYYGAVKAADPSRDTREKEDFYFHEYCLFLLHHLDVPFSRFNIDRAVNKVVLDGWGNWWPAAQVRRHPQYIPERPGSEDERGNINDTELFPPAEDGSGVAGDLGVLLRAAEPLRNFFHLNVLGFMPNIRHQRAMGLASLQIAQQVRRVWKGLRRSKRIRVLDVSASGSCSGGFKTTNVGESINRGPECDGSGRHAFGWRDAFDISVRWRQLCGVLDSVFWADVVFWLRSDTDLDTQSFSSTFLLEGQLRNVRYYEYTDKLFEKMRANHRWQMMNKRTPEAMAAAEAVSSATTMAEMREIVKADYWGFNTNPISSISRKPLFGTHVSWEVRPPKPGFFFSIKTSRYRIRNDIFNKDLNALWFRLTSEARKRKWDRSAMTDIVLRVLHVYFNMMPLNRGTAGTGMAVLQGLMLAIGVELTEPMPEGVMLDFESLYMDDPGAFVKFVRSFIPADRPTTTIDVDSLPDMSSLFPTTRHMMAAIGSAVRNMPVLIS